MAGGEPLLYPHLDDMVEKIDKTIAAPKSIIFATNGSLLLKRAKPLHSIVNKLRLKYAVSVHIEQIDIDKFVQNILDFGYLKNIQVKF